MVFSEEGGSGRWSGIRGIALNHSFLHKGTGKKYLATDIGLAIGVQKAASFGH